MHELLERVEVLTARAASCHDAASDREVVADDHVPLLLHLLDTLLFVEVLRHLVGVVTAHARSLRRELHLALQRLVDGLPICADRRVVRVGVCVEDYLGRWQRDADPQLERREHRELLILVALIEVPLAALEILDVLVVDAVVAAVLALQRRPDPVGESLGSLVSDQVELHAHDHGP